MKSFQIIIVLSLFVVIGCSNQNAELQQQVLLQQQQLQEMQLQQLQIEQASEQVANDAEMAQKARWAEAFYANYNNKLIDDELTRREVYLENIHKDSAAYFKNVARLNSDWSFLHYDQNEIVNLLDFGGFSGHIARYKAHIMTTPSICREKTNAEQERVLQVMETRQKRDDAIFESMKSIREKEVKEELARRTAIRREQDARNAVEYNRQFGAPPPTRIIVP